MTDQKERQDKKFREDMALALAGMVSHHCTVSSQYPKSDEPDYYLYSHCVAPNVWAMDALASIGWIALEEDQSKGRSRVGRWTDIAFNVKSLDTTE